MSVLGYSFDYEITVDDGQGEKLSGSGSMGINIPDKEIGSEADVLGQAVSAATDHFYTFEIEKKGRHIEVKNLTVTITNLTLVHVN